jgi:hypothetical protein
MLIRLSPATKQLVSVALIVLFALCVSGCGSGAKVSGTVKYQGKPITSGFIVFMDAQGKVSQPASIQPDGSYTATDVPLGSVKVTIDNPPPPGYGQKLPPSDNPEEKAAQAAAATYVPIPIKYKDPQKSGKTFEVKPGRNTCDLELEGPLDWFPGGPPPVDPRKL